MQVQNVIVEAMEEVLGIEKEELSENLDMDLIENELLDSLGIVTLLSEIGSRLGRTFDMANMSANSFRTVRKLTAAVEAQL